MKPTVAILGAPGTNRHVDLAFAFEVAGAAPEYVNVVDLPERQDVLKHAQIIAVAGGFSYADALGSARVFAQELMHRAGDLLKERIAEGTPAIGICNGFQMLVRSGLLPGDAAHRAALTHNENAKFECRWVNLKVTSNHCVWTRDVENILTCPVAHGEGRFITDDASLRELENNNQVAVRYVQSNGATANNVYPANPNGSMNDIAGICDASGLVLGMMPHPENHVVERQGRSGSVHGSQGLALQLFTNGVQHVTHA